MILFELRFKNELKLNKFMIWEGEGFSPRLLKNIKKIIFSRPNNTSYFSIFYIIYLLLNN